MTLKAKLKSFLEEETLGRRTGMKTNETTRPSETEDSGSYTFVLSATLKVVSQNISQ